MKAKAIVKIILDVVLTALFVILLFAYQTGLVFHEVMGISILSFVILHIFLNWKWVSRVFKNLFHKIAALFARVFKKKHAKLTPALENDPEVKDRLLENAPHHKSVLARIKAVLVYVLDIGVLLGTVLITVSGIMISQVLFPVELFNEFLFQLHRWSSYVAVGCMGLHLLLHTRYILAMFKTLFTKLRTPAVSSTLNNAFGVLLILALVFTGLISNIQYTYDNRFFAGMDFDFEGDPNNDRMENLRLRAEEVERQRQAALEQYRINVVERRQMNNNTIDDLRINGKGTTLQGFLGSMFCTQCWMFCPLNATRCASGGPESQEAQRQYASIMATLV